MHQIQEDEPDIGTNLTFGWDIGGAFSVTETYLAAIKVGDNNSCPHTLSGLNKVSLWVIQIKICNYLQFNVWVGCYASGAVQYILERKRDAPV